MSRVFNFSAGPAELPEEVLKQVRSELLNWRRTGMSVLELPHRGEAFHSIAREAEADLRELLAIPSNYTVLFLPGGGRLQFAMVPMNLAASDRHMAYVDTGLWSHSALVEARLYGKVHVAADASTNGYTELPPDHTWDIPEDVAYLHYTDNETVHGLEFSAVPQVGDIPLISDMSSNILSRPVDVSRYGLIYACAQKNAGPAGVTLVIIRNDLLEREPFPFTPSMLRYKLHAKEHSLYNTPPTFSWYVVGLVLRWIKKEGGVQKFAERCKKKSAKLYQVIDNSDFYINKVKPCCRSRMNVIFTLAGGSLMEQKFLKEAEKGGLTNLKGHATVGGIRASIYNAMPDIGVDALAAFMCDFEKRFG